jgi:hypothetical protein
LRLGELAGRSGGREKEIKVNVAEVRQNRKERRGFRNLVDLTKMRSNI